MKGLILMAVLGLFIAVPVAAQQTVTIYFEDFDGVGTTDDLDGWEIGAGWDIDSGTPSNGSGVQSLRVFGSPGGPAITPLIDLRRLSEGSLTYLARRTSSFYPNSIMITASIDGGETYPILVADSTESLASGTGWSSFSFDLPVAVLGEADVRFRFENFEGGSGSANAKFDDLAVSGLAIFDVQPPDGLFAAEPGDTDQQTFTLTNYGTERLVVHAPTLSTSVFSIVPSTGVTLLPDEEQVYTITFAPTEDGVVQDQLDITTDGAGGVTVPLLGLTALNQVSFSFEASSGGESEKSIPVDLSLTFSNVEANLQGLQLSITWDDDIVQIADVVPGPRVSNSGWSLSYEATDQSVDILLFDDHGVGLLPDHYEPIVTLLFDASLLNNGEREAVLSIDNVIGALAVPTADDAELFIKQGEHTLLIEKRYAYFTIDVEEVDFGILTAGSSDEATFIISNPNGERPLGITSLDFSNGPYTVEPASATIDPNGSETFTITFAPTLTDFGLADVTLDISHDGELNGVHSLSVIGLGIYGRGDNDGDGMVDAMDIINTVDFILDRVEPSSLQLQLADLYPFDAGDANLDVRDLSVSVQAIVRGIWPDDVALPASYDPEIASTLAAKTGAVQPSVVVAIHPQEEDLVLEFETTEPLRALQVHLNVENLAGAPHLMLNSTGSPVASGRADADVEQGVARILLYRPEGGTIEPGTYRFATIPRSAANGFIDRDYATAIAEGNARLRVDFVGLVETAIDQEPLDLEFKVHHPYPNPFSLSAGSTLQIPVDVKSTNETKMEIFDILGRRLRVQSRQLDGKAELVWDGRAANGSIVAPGLYFVRVSNEGQHLTRQLVVVR